jgi:hypothetical protein
MQSVLLALLVCTIIISAERVLIQLINISYHHKQLDDKIRGLKRNIYLLSILYETSRSLYPAYCSKFVEEDNVIQGSILDHSLGSKKGTSNDRSGRSKPLQLIREFGRDASRMSDKMTAVLGTITSEITGKTMFDPNSVHSVVLTALERDKSAEALAKRIWVSFVAKGRNELSQYDLREVFGADRQNETNEIFAAIDRDGNGDIKS